MFYMFFAEGFEEVEAVATLDVLRRAKIGIKSVGVASQTVIGSHSMKFVCDETTDSVSLNDEISGVILPGGMPGTTNLFADVTVNKFIDYCNDNNLYICAICAAPMILGKKGLLDGRKAVCFPGFEEELLGAEIADSFVCTDGRIITAKGMGSAVDFGLEIVSAIKGHEYAADLRNTLQIPR